jgi:hypothetical protein
VHPIGYFLCGVTPQKRGHFQIPLWDSNMICKSLNIRLLVSNEGR